jgi:hypothetical protein
MLLHPHDISAHIYDDETEKSGNDAYGLQRSVGHCLYELGEGLKLSGKRI